MSGFAQALENGDSSKSPMVPAALFIRPDGLLYCYRLGGMSASEWTYRIERFLKDVASIHA